MFITEDSKALHTIINYNYIIKLEIIYNRRRSTKQARLGFGIDSILIKREA